MKLSLRKKIISTNLIVLVITFLVVSLVVMSGLDILNNQMLIRNLIHQADISVLSIKQSLLSGEKPSADEGEFTTRGKDFASKLSRETGMRVLVFSREKELIADSHAGKIPLPISEFEELDEVLKSN